MRISQPINPIYSETPCTFETKYATAAISYQQRAFGTILNGEIALTGGRSSGNKMLDDIQMVSLTDAIFSDKRLPRTLDSHCILHVNSTTLGLIGGSISSAGTNTPETWFVHINAEDNSWRAVTGPDLIKHRRMHACGTFEYQSEVYMVAVGGCCWELNEVSNTMEILNIKDTKWFAGKLHGTFVL